MLQLLHTHSYCADYMNTTVHQATNLHQSELQLNLTLATLYSLFLLSSHPFIFITCYWQMVSVPRPLIYYSQCISLLHRSQHYEAENPLLLHLRKEEWIIFIIYIYTMCYYQPGGGMIVFAINGFDLIWFDLIWGRLPTTDIVNDDDCTSIPLQFMSLKPMIITGKAVQQKEWVHPGMKTSPAVAVACPLNVKPGILHCSVFLLQAGQLPGLWRCSYTLHLRLRQCCHRKTSQRIRAW